MSVNQQETYTKYKSNKTLDTSKSKSTFFTQLNSLLTDIHNFFIWILNKINKILSKCSILTHFIIILIPVSIIFIFIIFFIHLKFYDTLFRFNYYKGVKEEFLDLYITQIDDMHSELETFLIKENYLDVENLLFFEIYFKELISVGLLDNKYQPLFPDIKNKSQILHKNVNDFFEKFGYTQDYMIPNDQAENFIDKRNDSLRELAKIYYYMFPIINYGAFSTNVIIDQTTLIAYEFDENRNIMGEELYFSFPKKVHPYNAGHNFLLSHGFLNPAVSKTLYKHTKLINDSFYNENYFKMQDSDFRKFVNLNENGGSLITFSHLNYENNGNITKTLAMTLQLSINRQNRHFIINIVFNLQQMELNSDTIEYTALLINNNIDTHNTVNEKYSDNDTFVLSKSDFIEYSLTNLENKFFHYGLYDSNNNFYKNGVNYDAFNLEALSNPLKYYSTVDGFNIDLKYLSNLYLYTKIFQNIDYSYYKKEGEEVNLFFFSDEKIKQICKNINFTKYLEYINSEKNIDCWDSQNKLYYDDNYKEVALFDSYASLPHCSCLPLYCLNNYKTLKKEKYKISEDNFVTKINLPDKCQNNFNFYYNEKDPNYNNSYITMISSWVYNLFNSESKTPESEYIKFKKENITQLPGYYLLVISEIKSNTQSLFYLFYNINNKIEIMILILIILFLTFSITIVIIYKNLKKYSLIIEEFKQKYEEYVYHSVCSEIMSSSSHDDYKNQNNNDERRMDELSMNNENAPFLQNDNALLGELYNNDNTLIEDLFAIYCKYYNICRKQIENYYSKKKHETRYQTKLKMMTEKNELFKLLCMFSIYAPFFRLNLSLDYKMYNYSKIIKKYNQYVTQVAHFDKEQTRLTQNILYELLSTENVSDYGLVMNLNFKYVSNINAEFKENCIQYALFKNVINKIKGKNEEKENDMNINDIFFIIKDGDEKQNVKLVLKKKNELMELFKSKFESDDYLNINKIESSFNFFLINSYYKYLKQILLEENNTK